MFFLSFVVIGADIVTATRHIEMSERERKKEGRAGGKL